METITSELVAGLAPVRSDDGHKGTFGTALLIAGSEYMTGAQVLMTSSALRSGAGMVRVYAPDGSLLPTRVNCPCALTSAWGDTEASAIRELRRYLAKASCCGIGPGLDESDRRSKALLETLIDESPGLVIDAGALNILARDRVRLFPRLKARCDKEGFEPAVLTPHIGEFRRLTGGQDQSCLVQFARDTGCVTVLKSNNTIVSSTDGKCYINNISNSGLAKGGSGDVLSGLITGLMSQGIDALSASIAAVRIHAECGLILADECGKRAMLPQDMPAVMGRAFKACGWERDEY